MNPADETRYLNYVSISGELYSYAPVGSRVSVNAELQRIAYVAVRMRDTLIGVMYEPGRH